MAATLTSFAGTSVKLALKVSSSALAVSKSSHTHG